MQKSFKQRLEALEALESEQADHVLGVFLYIRPADYAALCGEDANEATRVFVAYGLDQIGNDERVSVTGGTWPYPLVPNELTIYHQQDAEGYGIRVDKWRLYPDAPAVGEWRWCMGWSG